MQPFHILSYLRTQPFIHYMEPKDLISDDEPETTYRRSDVAAIMQEHRAVMLKDHAVVGGYVGVSALQYDNDAVWFDCDITDQGEAAIAAMHAGWWWDGMEHRIDETETERCWRGRINAVETPEHPVFNEIKRITAPRLAWVRDEAFMKKLHVWTPK